MMAQEAVLEGVMNSKLIRLLAYNKTSSCADIRIGNSVFWYTAPIWKSQPNWRGPARVWDIDETGAIARYRSQTF